MDIVNIAPENLEIANSYLSTGSAIKTAEQLSITPDKVMDVIEKREVKTYIDGVYLGQGYRNRFRLAELLDEVIEHKIEEARESDVYSTKDLADLISLAHKMSQDHAKAPSTNVKNLTAVQINENPFGTGNYGKLMEKLLGDSTG